MKTNEIKQNELFKQVTQYLNQNELNFVIDYIDSNFSDIYMKSKKGRVYKKMKNEIQKNGFIIINNEKYLKPVEHIVFHLRKKVFDTEKNKFVNKDTIKNLNQILAVKYPYYNKHKHYSGGINKSLKEFPNGAIGLKDIHVFNKKGFSDNRQRLKTERYNKKQKSKKNKKSKKSKK